MLSEFWFVCCRRVLVSMRAGIEWAQHAWFKPVATEVYILWNKRGFLGYPRQNRTLSEIIQFLPSCQPANVYLQYLTSPRSWYYGMYITSIQHSVLLNVIFYATCLDMGGFQRSTCLTTNAKGETSTDLQNKDNQLHGRRVALKSRTEVACNW